jgi:hypothetical protein
LSVTATIPLISTKWSTSDYWTQKPLGRFESINKFDWFMVLNVTFIISWLSVLFVEETRIPGENHPPVASHFHKFEQVNGLSQQIFLYSLCHYVTVLTQLMTSIKYLLSVFYHDVMTYNIDCDLYIMFLWC